MTIHDGLAKTYLEGGDLAQFRDRWYFADSDLSRTYGKNVFTLPPEDDTLRPKAQVVYDTILDIVSDFTPAGLAAELYDGLYPNWRELTDGVTVDLIAGLPAPHDAVVCTDPEGGLHMLFDIIRWTGMVDYDLAGNARGILTHEFFHVLMHTQFPAEDAPDYLSALDQITFHEGFAHFVQLASMANVDWHSQKLADVRERSADKLRRALAETDEAQQETYLYEAHCGGWYDKYAAMSGMLYLRRLWERGGVPALRDALDAGPVGFAQKTC